MPLSTSYHSVLAPTSTLSNVLENSDHGRLAYSSHNSKTLRPAAQSNNFPSPNGNANIAAKPLFAYESNSTSPSTTTSTLNSALADTSPDSSPHSANSLHQAPFKQPRLNTNIVTDVSMEDVADDTSPVRPSTSASDSAALRKGRNMKNLSINTNGISARQNIDSRTAVKDGLAQRPVTQSGPASTFVPGSLPPVSESAPVSPSFIIPKMPPRRKPSKLGLTIATPDSEQKAAIPPTPSFNATFATRQPIVPIQLQTIPQTPAFPPPSSPDQPTNKANVDNLMSPSLGPPGGMSFPSITGRELRTPGLAPTGGMTLPPYHSVESSPSKESSPVTEHYRPLQDHMGLYRHRSAEKVGDASSIVNQTIEHINNVPSYDRPLSQEIKSPSYPEGPACIYPPYVYLYHQPTAAEARKFDVIINVAREVTNPFEAEAEEVKAQLRAKDTKPIRLSKPSYRSVGVQVDLLTENSVQTLTSDNPKDHRGDLAISAVMDRMKISITDDVPSIQDAAKPKPEYLHLPWEHNSKVYEDWFEICQLISERTKKGKKVLIHCQLGVSRSASLIVAYGIYLNPHLSPDEAREQAKQRSRWIDINMHFMYELGDFKKLLAVKGMVGADAPRMGSVSGQGPKPPPLGLMRSKTDVSSLSPVQSVPVTPMSVLSPVPGSAPLTGQEGHDGQFARISDNGLRTPGPSSAPADVTWSPLKRPKGMEDETMTAFPAVPEDQGVGLRDVENSPASTPPELPIKQISSGVKTPGFDMPGGWATTPAVSRPTSMVLPEINTIAMSLQGAGHTDDRMADGPVTLVKEPPIEGDTGPDSKPSRAPSFRRLPKMPSLPSGFTTSIGSFFSLNRSSSSASKKSQSPAPSRPVSISSRSQTRLDTIPGTPISGPSTDSVSLPALRKPPSLPTLRTIFPLGGGGEYKHGRPGLSLTLDPIPQSAVGGDQEAMAKQDEALAALMSPRAQEFVHNPFNRPVTSHVAIGVRGSDQNSQRSTSGFASMFSGFSQIGIKKQRSGQSLRSLTPEIFSTTAQGQAVSVSTNGALPILGRKASTGSHVTVIQRDEALDHNETQESPGTEPQARDPRSPPSVGVWGTEERILPNIDDIL